VVASPADLPKRGVSVNHLRVILPKGNRASKSNGPLTVARQLSGIAHSESRVPFCEPATLEALSVQA
jgi:hypothetical protein